MGNRLGFARVVAFVIGCCATAGAQFANRGAEAVIVPREGGTPTGGGWPLFHHPCNGTSVLFYQILFEVPPDAPTLVRSIAFRRPNVSVPVDLPAFTVEAEIAIGHSPSSPAQFGWERPMNRGADFQLVFRKKFVSFQASRHRPDQNYPFEYRFALDTPFSFQPGENAVIELRISASTICNGTPRPVAVWFRGYDSRRPGFRFGTSCSRFGPGPNSLSVWGVSPGNPGFARMSPVGASAGPNLSRYFGSLRRLDPPFRLDSLGAPGCSVYIPFDWEFPTYWGPLFPDAALDLPNDPNLTGLTMYIQGIRLDRSANRLGVDTSDGWAAPISPHIAARVSMLRGPAGPSPDGGHRSLGGPVFQLSGY